MKPSGRSSALLYDCTEWRTSLHPKLEIHKISNDDTIYWSTDRTTRLMEGAVRRRVSAYRNYPPFYYTNLLQQWGYVGRVWTKAPTDLYNIYIYVGIRNRLPLQLRDLLLHKHLPTKCTHLLHMQVSYQCTYLYAMRYDYPPSPIPCKKTTCSSPM